MALTKVQIDGVEFSDSTDLNVDNGTLFVDATNNRVGVGTTTVASTLHVSGSSDQSYTFQTTTSGADNRINFRNSGGVDAGGVWYKHNGNHLLFNTGGSNQEKARIDSSGRLGVGTSSPSSYNADAADLVIGSSGSNGLTIVSGTTNNGNIFFADGTSGDDQLRGFIQYNHQLDFFNIGTNATSAIRIDSSQRVGIGTTSPAYKCDIDTTSSALRLFSTTTAAKLAITSDDAANAIIEFGDESDDDRGAITYNNPNNALIFQANAAERVRIDSSGRLLVGTTSVGHANADELTLANTSGAAGLTIRAAATYNSNVYFGDVSGADDVGRVEYRHNGNTMRFYTNGDERFQIGSSGQLGIGGSTYGSSGQVLTSQGSGSAPQWATPAGGKVLQVQSTTTTAAATYNGSSFHDIGLSVSITPTSTSSKILVLVSLTSGNGGPGVSVDLGFRLVRNTTAIAVGDASGSRTQITFGCNVREGNEGQVGSMNFLDSPSTTSAVTYKMQGISTNGATYSINSEYAAISGNAASYMRSASTITVMEIAA